MLLFLAGLGYLLGSLIGAGLLRTAANSAENLDIPFAEAFGTMLLTNLIAFAISLPFSFALVTSGAGKGSEAAMHVVLAPVVFLIQSGMISSRHSLSFGQGVKIAGFMLLFGLLIGIIIGGIGFMAIIFIAR